jgi:SAM-dependent methyltransferase
MPPSELLKQYTVLPSGDHLGLSAQPCPSVTRDRARISDRLLSTMRRSTSRSSGFWRGALLCCTVVTAAQGSQTNQNAPVPRPSETEDRPPAHTPDIQFVPTRQAIVDAMLRLARVGPEDVVYDLGSGDGRIVIIAAEKYGARGVGIELVPRLVEMSRELARQGQLADRVTFIEGDLFTADISEATVVTLYLSPSINRRLLPKLTGELRPGTRIVSRQFRLGSWIPDVTVRAEDGTDLFLWTVPPRAEP